MPEEERINVARQAARKAKTAYEEAVVQRSNSQREVNDLLQRKNTWVDNDVVRFTNLVRQDHLYEQEELRAKAAVDETEDGVEREFSQLMRTILARYHEEQVWSDKIRSASTYGSLAALGLNMFVFILAILIVEPWKRRRLTQTFERKIEELSTENETRLDASMQAINQQFARQGALLEALKEEVTRNVQESLPETVSAAHEDTRGETLEDRSDVQVLSWAPSQRQLEMAAVGAGAFVVGILGTVLFSQ
jgi:sensitive to high expression protein 9